MMVLQCGANQPNSFGAHILDSHRTMMSSPIILFPPRLSSRNRLLRLLWIDLICQTVQSAALLYDLPQEFLTRLIWQESRFNPNAVSSKGAQGVAQFMPKTAAWVGLNNPWDPVEAITKSAQLLRDLKRQFGNLGLAAAAYNAGPKRVQEWVAGTRFLPRETQAYVRIVTGRPANEWTNGNSNPSLANRPDGVPCPDLLKAIGNNQVTDEETVTFTGPNVAVVTPRGTRPGKSETFWFVQLAGGDSGVSCARGILSLARKIHSNTGGLSATHHAGTRNRLRLVPSPHCDEQSCSG